MILTADTLRAIRRIELRTRKLVNDFFAGAYHAIFKGRGIAFDAVRPYEPGDDVRDIDWNVTARADAPYIKRYIEERELTVMLVLDASASSSFGTVNRQKRDLAAELGAVLAFTAISNNDRVGLLVFSDQIELFIPPRKGRNHVLRLIRDLLAAKPAHTGTDISLALRTINTLLRRRAIVFLISDFLASSQEYARDLLVTGRRHDVIAVVVSDPREQSWPDVGLAGLRDAETDTITWIDTSSEQWRKQFSQQAHRFQRMRDEALARAEIDRIDVRVDDDHVQALTAFFKKRAQRVRR
jgi:uncharacterized protein (DUF58 family)